MDKLPHLCLKEYIIKQNRRTAVNESYLPDRRAPLITSKFYSRHDKEQDAKYDPGKRKNIKILEECRNKYPQEKYESPVTESHRYGWNLPAIEKLDEIDRRILFKPRASSQMTKHGAQIAKEKFIYRSGPFVKCRN